MKLDTATLAYCGDMLERMGFPRAAVLLQDLAAIQKDVAAITAPPPPPPAKPVAAPFVVQVPVAPSVTKPA